MELHKITQKLMSLSNKYYRLLFPKVFSICSLTLILLLLQTNCFSQNSDDVKKAVNEQNIEKLIKLYDKASKKNISSIKSRIEKAIKGMNDPILFNDMVSTLGNENANIRSAAAIALGKMNDPRVLDPLILALNDRSKNVQESAAFALASTNNPHAVIILAQRIVLGEDSYERSALKKMENKLLTEALNDKNPTVRSGVAQALGKYHNYNAIDPLVAALKDENATVQKSIIYALSRIEDSIPLRPLIRVAETDNDADVKQSATFTIVNLKADTLAVDIYATALNSDNDCIKEKAAKNLISLDIPKAKEYQLQSSIILLDNKNEKLRFKAAKTILNSDDTVPDDIINKAREIIKEKCYLESFILYDEHGRKVSEGLSNIDGKRVASKYFEYHKFNGSLISRTVTIKANKNDTIRITEYNNFGRREKYTFLCLDKDGNILKEEGKPIFVESFIPTQKATSKINYVGFSKRKAYETIKIFPCQDCVEKTGFVNCKYVW